MTEHRRTPLAPNEIEKLRAKYAFLPQDYFQYLSNVGWGETDSGRMIYGGPTGVAEIYGPNCSVQDVVLLGDDFQGFCFGYNWSSFRYGEVSDDGIWEEWSSDLDIWYYVSDGDS